MVPHEDTHEAGENIPATPAYLQHGSPTAAEQGECCEHLQVFDYVTSPHGNGVVIHLWPQRVGVILDATSEVVYFERPEDIDQIRPVAFIPGTSSLQEQTEVAAEEDEYRYLDPHAWPYNDPNMTDEYLLACGFLTREAAGFPFPRKPEHVDRLRGATLVSTPQGRGKLWRNWDTQIAVILEGTQRVPFFRDPKEWALIFPLDESSLSVEETKQRKPIYPGGENICEK
jgi:hypothetical protein